MPPRARPAASPLSKGKLLLVLALLGLAAMWWSALGKKAPVTTANALKPAKQETSTDTNRSALPAAVLPTRIERDAMEPALRDPFVAYAPPAPAQPKIKSTPAPLPPVFNAPPAAVAAPSPPALNLRYVGQMTAPNGDRMIYVASGDSTVMLTQGQTLPNGYQVTSISDRQVNFTYAPLGYTTQLSLPEAPRYETR